MQNLKIFHWAGNIELTKVTSVTLSGLFFLSLSCHPNKKLLNVHMSIHWNRLFLILPDN